MFDLLSKEERVSYESFLEFSKLNVSANTSNWEKNEAISEEIKQICAQEGYMGGAIPTEYGGKGWDFVTYGLFNEAIARNSVSLSGLFNVHTMVALTILKWGTEIQKEKWLQRMAKGEIIGAFALTEPVAGSDVQGIETEYRLENDKLVLNGCKRWITFGGIADLFVVFGKIDGKPIACLVEKNTPGLTINPVGDMLGFKASHLAILNFENCIIDKENIIGKEGFAFQYIAPYALEFGRISVAWAALGIIRGCLENCGQYAMDRKTFGNRLIEHGMIQTMITEMGVDLEASKLLCLKACKTKDNHLPKATEEIMYAKYFTTKAAVKHSANAVQILGASGCKGTSSVSRYYRDSKTMEIIEGSNQIHEMILGKSFARKAKKMISKSII